jgi:hypothetical protein
MVDLPLTPCMPCHPHHFTQPSAALPSTASVLRKKVPRRGAVVRRKAACGIAADNLLTGCRDLYRLPGAAELPPRRGPPRPCRTTQASRSMLELVFDMLARWGPGTTWTWAGRSRPRWSSARSCSAWTSSPSGSWRQGRALPPRRRHQDLEPDAAGAPAPPRALRPAPRRLPRPSTNEAVALTGLTRLTGTSGNRNGPRQHPRTP